MEDLAAKSGGPWSFPTQAQGRGAVAFSTLASWGLSTGVAESGRNRVVTVKELKLSFSAACFLRTFESVTEGSQGFFWDNWERF